MIVARQLRTKSRAEYLLYMWQVEDIIRNYHCDIDRINAEYLSRFNIAEEDMQAMYKWYAELCDMMRSEGKTAHGHLQINETTLTSLEDLHARLLASPDFPAYRARYEQVLPYIVELRAKSGKKAEELDTCELRPLFEMLYVIIFIKLAHGMQAGVGTNVSEETGRAVRQVTNFLSMLSELWLKDHNAELDV